MENNKFEIPPEGMDTPDGFLYYPPKQGIQTLFLILSFFTAILLGLIISSIPGDLSDAAAGFIYFIYIVIFILGYTTWAGTVSVMVFGSLKIPVFRALYRFFIRREKPKSIHEFLPTREEAAKIMLRAQKSTRTFYLISWPIGIAGGLLSTFMSTSLSSSTLFVLITAAALLYGYGLSYFGRRGYFPFPEG